MLPADPVLATYVVTMGFLMAAAIISAIIGSLSED